MTLLSAIDRHLYETGTAPSAFSRRVSGNSRLVSDLRRGRRLKLATETRVRLFIDSYNPAASSRAWCSGVDAELFARLMRGEARRMIAFRLGMSVAAVHDRVNLLADDWFPDSPAGAWISRFRARRMHRDPISKVRPRFWTEHRDIALLRMAEAGQPHSAIAAHFGVSASAARQRLLKITARYFPDKPARMTLTEYLFAFRVRP